MSTGIQWTDETWNPVVGCTKVSQGCKNCYAKTLHDMRHKAMLAGKTGLAPQYAQPFEVVQVMDDRFLDPLSWRKPRRVFVNSVSDLFHEDIPEDQIVELLGIMALASHHTFQILTKRPERQRAILNALKLSEVLAAAGLAFARLGAPQKHYDALNARLLNGPYDWPLPNVWLGTSTENQAALDARLPELMATSAAVRFLSCEPLLGPIEIGIDDIASRDWEGRYIDWVIVGGESGPKARFCHVEWIEDVVAQCDEFGVPVFVKQMGKWLVGDHEGFIVDRWLQGDTIFVPPIIGERARQRPPNAVAFGLCDRKGGSPIEWPERLRVRQFPEAA